MTSVSPAREAANCCDHTTSRCAQLLAAVTAEPVFRLLGKQGLGTDQLPPAGTPILRDIGYSMHDGGHGMLPADWDVFLRFMEIHLK